MAEGKSILVVDDDQDLCEAMRLVLEQAGYDVIVASDSKEAQKAVTEHRPDAILLDVMMPSGTEGFHFAWDLRRNPDPDLAKTPIVVITALHEKTPMRFYPEMSDTVYGPGEFLPVQAFLEKPLRPDELLRVVGEMVGGAHPSE